MKDFRKPFSKYPSQAKMGEVYLWFGYDSPSLDRTKHIEGEVVEIIDGRDWRRIGVKTQEGKIVSLWQ